MSGLDLYLDQRVLFRMLLVALTLGAALGLLFDLFEVCRTLLLGPVAAMRQEANAGRVASRKYQRILHALLRFLGDGLFALISAIACLLLCYYTSDGQVRSPAVMGTVGGFVLYRYTLRRLLIPLTDAVVRLLRAAMYRLLVWSLVALRFLWTRLLWRCLLRPPLLLMQWLWRHTGYRILMHTRKRRTDRVLRLLVEDAAHGFELGEATPVSPSPKTVEPPV